jgi:hypothetical protein
MEHMIISRVRDDLNKKNSSPVPFPRSYWVIPGEPFAGNYPGVKDPKEATAKLTAIINCGIRHVINLMEPAESLCNRKHII